jgi:hypothetical protein
VEQIFFSLSFNFPAALQSGGVAQLRSVSNYQATGENGQE